MTVGRAGERDASGGEICVFVVAYAQIAGWCTNELRLSERPPSGRGLTVGHIKVVFSQYEVPPQKDYTCRPPQAGGYGCGRYGCVEAAATPQRIWEDLRDSGLAPSLEAGAARALTYEEADAEFDPAEPFSLAGHLAGRAVAMWVTAHDPARMVVFLPRILLNSPEGTAGSRYRRALEGYVERETFSSRKGAPWNVGKVVPWTFLPTEDTFGSDPRPLPGLLRD